ncbi:MAG: hypothetical protein HC916_03485 [Coleofasciculaceae cyanobacterium SM2_1_6]|nr:hypothetical protein [Coleofasciculaceae cyanobacterium SM2_1_6]
MKNSSTSSLADDTADRDIWDSLKKTIASSSGFQRWQLEKALLTALPDPTTATNLEQSEQPEKLDQQVRSYLRETLETLAY